MSDWRCADPECRAVNPRAATSCEVCGQPAPAQWSDTRTGSAQTPSRCPHDGTPLMANGWCPTGEGFPLARSCPFVCDRCRAPLTWQGTCLTCPDPTGNTVGYAPGDRYDYDEKNPHWRLVEKGPFTLCTPEENAAHARLFAETLARLTARMRARP